MSDHGHGSQQSPIANDGPSAHDLVTADLAERRAFGLRKYGTLLQPNNGRDHLQDAYEEALDLACYLRNEIEQRRMNDAPTICGVRWEDPNGLTCVCKFPHGHAGQHAANNGEGTSTYREPSFGYAALADQAEPDDPVSASHRPADGQAWDSSGAEWLDTVFGWWCPEHDAQWAPTHVDPGMPWEEVVSHYGPMTDVQQSCGRGVCAGMMGHPGKCEDTFG